MSDGPIYMLNVLWFKPNGGAERYKECLQAAGPVVARYGGRKLDAYAPDMAVIGELDADLIFMVEWPSWEVFQNFIHDPDFEAIRELREAALSNSLLIRCRRAG